MPRDVGIRISANTTDAKRSIKELEDTIQGMSDLRSREGQQGGFLNKDDIAHFRSLSSQATQIYRNFYNNYQDIVSKMESKRRDLEQQIKLSTDTTRLNELKRQIADLDLKRVQMSSQRTVAENLRTRGAVYSQPPLYSSGGSGNGSGTGTTGGSQGGFGGFFLSKLAGIFGAIGFGNVVRGGMSQISQQESSMAQLGTRIGGYGVDFARGRREAGQVGVRYGYTSAETINLADQYTSLAGASSPQNMWNSVRNIEQASRQLGVNASQLAQAQGSISRVGGITGSTEQRNFANLIAGAVRADNMQGRQGELINSINSLVQQTAYGQPEYNNQQVNTVAGLESLIGQYAPGFKGQLGAQMLGGIDQSIRNGGQSLDLLMGWGTKYQGIQGRYQLEMNKAQGISNPENLSGIFKRAQTYGSDEKSNQENQRMQEMILSQNLGISLPQVHALYGNRRLREKIIAGDYSDKDLQRLMQQGQQLNNAYGNNWFNSAAGEREMNQAEWSRTQQATGTVPDWLQHNILGAWNGGQPPWMRGTELGLAAGGLWYASSRLHRLLSNRIEAANGKGTLGQVGRIKGRVKNLFSKAGKGTSSFLRDLFKNGGGKGGSSIIARSAGLGSLGAMGRLIAPLGMVETVKDMDSASGGFVDWLTGHNKGEVIPPGIFSNPFSTKQEHYTDNRKGAIQRLFETVTGGGNSRETDRRDQQVRREENLEERKRENLNRRDRVINQEEKVNQDYGNRITDTNGDHTVRRQEESGNWFTRIFSKVGTFLSNFLGLGGSSDSGSSGLSNGISGAVDTALRLTNTPVSWAKNLMTLIQHESGGDPNAVNDWDSNAKAGHPSKGLMQMIDSTFKSYAISGHTDIFNPVDNIAAGIEYIKDRYGDISKVPGIINLNNGKGWVGYASGTQSSAGGHVVIGEGGKPELIETNDGRMALATQATSFNDFMSGSAVYPVNRMSEAGGVNWSANPSLSNEGLGGSGGVRSIMVNVRVSGAVEGLNEANNNKVSNAIAGYFESSIPLSYNFSRA